MAIIKLQNVGDAVTWRIKAAEVVAGKFGSQVKFESEGGDILFISEETAGRQLGRIKLDVANCAGETLTFSRSENPKGGAPYWDITVADAVDRAAPVQSKRLPPPSKKLPFDEDFPSEAYGESVADPKPPVMTHVEGPKVAPNAAKRAAIVDDYMALLTHVRKTMPDLGHDAAQAAAATIFISWDKAGVR